MTSARLVLPHDLDAEGCVLCEALLRGSDTIAELREIIDEGDFYSAANQTIWRALLAIDARGQSPDTVAVARELRETGADERVGGVMYLAQLVERPATVLGHLVEHARAVRAFARRRRAIATFQELAAEGYGEVTDLEEWLQSAESRTFLATSCIEDEQTAEDYAEAVEREFTRASTARTQPEAVRVTSTGLRSVDELTGGLKDGDFYIVAGRPGMGKTAIAQQMLQSVAANGMACVFFSMEMERAQIAQRAISQASGVHTRRLVAGQMSANEWQAAAEAVEGLARLAIRVDDRGVLSPARLRSRLRRHVATLTRRFGRRKLGAVVVDYMQLMRADGNRFRSREEELEQISRSMKRLAREFNTCVIGISQLNRESKDRKDHRPTLFDLRGSGAFEQDADLVAFVHRADAYRTDVNEHDGNAEVIIAKGRNCGTGSVTLTWEGWCTRFLEAEHESDARYGE